MTEKTFDPLLYLSSPLDSPNHPLVAEGPIFWPGSRNPQDDPRCFFLIEGDHRSWWTSLVAQTVKNPPAGFPGGLVVKNPLAMQETWVQSLSQEDLLEQHPPAVCEIWVQSLGWEDPLEEGMATHSWYSCLENPHGQRGLEGYSSWESQRVRHDWATKHSTAHRSWWRRKWQLTPVFLPGESHRQRSLAGYSPWGCRVRHDWANKHTRTHRSWSS